MSDCHNPRSPANGRKYHTGKTCIEPGCNEPAGTAWGPHWCWRHNAERLDRISAGFKAIAAKFEKLREAGR